MLGRQKEEGIACREANSFLSCTRAQVEAEASPWSLPTAAPPAALRYSCDHMSQLPLAK